MCVVVEWYLVFHALHCWLWRLYPMQLLPIYRAPLVNQWTMLYFVKCVLDKTKTSPSLAFLRFLFWSWCRDLRVVTFVPKWPPQCAWKSGRWYNSNLKIPSEVLWGQKLNKVSNTIFWQDHCMHERWLEWCLTCSIKIECHLQPQSTLIFSLIISLSLKWWRWGFCRWNSPSACRTRPISGTPSILTKRSWKGRQITSKNWSNKSSLSSTPQKVSSRVRILVQFSALRQVLQVMPVVQNSVLHFRLFTYVLVWRVSLLQFDQKACFAC